MMYSKTIMIGTKFYIIEKKFIIKTSITLWKQTKYPINKQKFVTKEHNIPVINKHNTTNSQHQKPQPTPIQGEVSQILARRHPVRNVRNDSSLCPGHHHHLLLHHPHLISAADHTAIRREAGQAFPLYRMARPWCPR